MEHLPAGSISLRALSTGASPPFIPRLKALLASLIKSDIKQLLLLFLSGAAIARIEALYHFTRAAWPLGIEGLHKVQKSSISSANHKPHLVPSCANPFHAYELHPKAIYKISSNPHFKKNSGISGSVNLQKGATLLVIHKVAFTLNCVAITKPSHPEIILGLDHRVVFTGAFIGIVAAHQISISLVAAWINEYSEY